MTVSVFGLIVGCAVALLGAFMTLRAREIADRSDKHRAQGPALWRLLGVGMLVSGLVQVLAAAL